MSYNIGYKKSDFFYSNVPANQLADCESKIKMNSCSSFPSDVTAQNNCISIELCKNQDYVNRLREIENNHLKAQESHVDTDASYKYQLLNLMNLGAGIIFSIWYIYYNR